MRTLELFAGTQSFSKGVARAGGEAITVDILPKFKPTHVADILTWDYTQYPPNHFNIVWCSPPCTEYSKAKTRGVRDLHLADSLVRRCFEILDYYMPKAWIVENVGTGLLVKRMDDIRPNLPSYLVDYCAYGKPYRKRTILWSNIPLDLKLCSKKHCPQMIGNKHIGSVDNGTSRYNSVGISSVWEKDAIPDSLIDDILTSLKTDET